MRPHIGLLLLLPVISHCHTAVAQEKQSLPPGYYIVVAAYGQSNEWYAAQYTDALQKDGHPAAYGFNSPSNLFLVYNGFYPELRAALTEMARLRRETRFKDAWVRVVPGDIRPGAANSPTEVSRSTDAAVLPESSTVQSETVVKDENDRREAGEAAVTTPEAITDTVVVTDNPEIVQHKQMTLGNTEVFLSLYNATNNRIVDGNIQVVDTDRAKLLTRVKGNEYLILPDPRSRSGQITLISEVFGYRRIQHEINYPIPLADTVKPHIELMGTTVVVNFDLVRYHKGDVATLYNVYFFNDASVMMPESRYELNSLLQLMQERPTYRIRLHGHTNGNYHGRILQAGQSGDFFSLDGAKSGVGSAKELSRLRGEAIKKYLVSHGISSDRIEVKEWGGRRPLFDRNGANAKKNVRVEVEILGE
jgi:outer membrane protein OmpA-like peptidoglycan-associated protein